MKQKQSYKVFYVDGKKGEDLRSREMNVVADNIGNAIAKVVHELETFQKNAQYSYLYRVTGCLEGNPIYE